MCVVALQRINHERKHECLFHICFDIIVCMALQRLFWGKSIDMLVGMLCFLGLP